MLLMIMMPVVPDNGDDDYDHDCARDRDTEHDHVDDDLDDGGDDPGHGHHHYHTHPLHKNAGLKIEIQTRIDKSDLMSRAASRSQLFANKPVYKAVGSSRWFKVSRNIVSTVFVRTVCPMVFIGAGQAGTHGLGIFRFMTE